MKIPKGLSGFSAYTAVLFSAIYALPPFAFFGESGRFIFTIGGLALWRYGWGLTHYIRHLIYIHIYFPRLRTNADEGGVSLLPSQFYFLVTSYKIDAVTTARVYEAVFAEALACNIPSKIIASIVDEADETLIYQLHQAYDMPPHIALEIIRIAGTGKRDGLAHGFKAIANDNPANDALVAVIDGDTILGSGLVQKCAPFFKLQSNLGALTTDEICDVKGSIVMREWHDLRFAQRQILMSSLSLSRKVLTLTGRMSIFRARIITDPGFVDTVQNDFINHWRLGEFRFLTGDDKSSWFWVLKEGWDMLYIPDVTVLTVEHPPSENFFKASSLLMFRWFGNMLRTNGRALRLGPHRMGLFAWWCVFDQRISMWTSLTGPAFALMFALKHSLIFLGLYLIWIGFTRWIMCLMLMAARPVTSWRYPFLIFYNQLWGALIKTYVLFRLDRQSWTRQKTKLQRNLTGSQERMNMLTSAVAHITAFTFFIALVGFISGIWTLPYSIMKWINF